MIRLIQLLFFGHAHKWEIIDKRRLDYVYDFSKGSCERYTLQCEHCGKIKVKDAK
jgi:uncharacterized protein CbrC (UPF0167 family)